MQNSKLQFKIKKLLQVAILLTFNFALLTFNLNEVKAQTIDPSVWQTGATGLRTSSNTDRKTAGLTAIIKASGIPFVSLSGGAGDAGWSHLGGPVMIDLGEIKNPGVTSATLGTEDADWAHNQMSFATDLGNTINVWVSRLSPAVLIQNQNNALRLFSGNLNGSYWGTPPWGGTTPYIYYRNPSPSYPKYVAYSSGGSINVQTIPASGLAALSLPVLDNNWLLVWYGNNSHFFDTQTPLSYEGVPHSDGYLADAPILIKFENSPTSIRQSSEGGIDLDFGVGVNSGYTSLMPLLGREHPKASDTESWYSTTDLINHNGLPPVIQDKINFWSQRLCSYPTNVLESYSYDAVIDTANISENITFLPVCSGGNSFAILPPFIALAKDSLGVNFTTSSTLVNALYPTEFGPIQGIDSTNSYSWSVKGLKKYTDSKRVATNPEAAPAAALVQELSTLVDKVTQAGHFKPWMFTDSTPRHDIRGEVYFLNPADVIYHLTEIAQALPDSVDPNAPKNRLVNYLKSEKNNYPPETIYNLPDAGTLRASQSLDNYTNWQRWGSPDNFLKRVPLYSFYALSKYYDLTAEPIPESVITSAKTALQNDTTEQDWATGAWFKGFGTKHTAVENTNRYLTGMVGLTKLAKTAGDSNTEALGRVLLAKTTLARLAMAKYPRYLYSSNILALPSGLDWMPRYTAGSWTGVIWNYNWSAPNDDVNQIAIIDQFGVFLYDSSGFMSPGTGESEWIYQVSAHLSAYTAMIPEIFRFLTDFAKQDIEVYVNKYTTLLPHWYMPNTEAVLGKEHGVNHPGDSFQIFMAKALIQKDTPDNLARYTSFPWLTDGSDFFYLHKLAETIKTYQGWVWEDELGGVTPTPVPTACALTSASWSSTGPMVEGTSVNLTVNTSGDCNGKNIEIKVFDDDGSIALNDEIITLPQVTAYGSTVTTSWTTVYTPDSDDPADILGDRLPEYFFEARVVGESGFTHSDYSQELVVTQLPVGEPSPTPTGISPTTSPVPTSTGTPSATLTPPVGGGECGLETASALWSTTSTPENTSVSLTVKGNGSACIGQSVEFNIRRNISVGFDEDITKLTASFNDQLTSTTTWTTPTWFDSCGGIDPRTCDPIYHFDALTGTNSQRSNDLTVTDYTPTASTDWPQVAKDPQHTGYSSEVLGTNFRVAWTYPFQPERVYPQVQAITYSGTVFVPTESGNVYAFNGSNGSYAWSTPFKTGGPVISSVAADNGLIYVSSLDGAIYALQADNGTQLWKTYLYKGNVVSSSPRLGFSASPLIADNKILIGGQDGYFYALNPSDGSLLWSYNTNAPILQTAAFNNGKVIFGTMDMYVYALNTSPIDSQDPSTLLAWKSAKILGMGFNDYYPVITQGRVIIRPVSKLPEPHNGPSARLPIRGIPVGDLSDNAQNTVLANYDSNPANYAKTLYILDENNGQELPGVIHWDWGLVMNGAAPAPCVDKDGYLIIGGRVPYNNWVRLNLLTRKIASALVDGQAVFNNINKDENYAVSCNSNGVFTIHHGGTALGGAAVTGFYNLNSGSWTIFPLTVLNLQLGNNTQGGGASPLTISNGILYHIEMNNLVARTTQ